MPRRPLMAALLALVLASGASGQRSLTVNRVIQVGATGTPTENCTALRDVLTGLAGGTSEEQAYLVKLEPGKYECDTSTVSIPPWVSVQGSGPETTRIFGRPNSPDTGIVHFDNAGNAGLRRVRVHHWGDTQDAVAISVVSSLNVYLEHLVAWNLNPGKTDVVIRVEGGPTSDDKATVVIRDVLILANTTRDAILTKETGTGLASVVVFDSVVDGNANTTAGGSVKCMGSYSGASAPLDINCNPPLP